MGQYVVSRLRIEGMRSVDCAELGFERRVPTVLIGPNGAGKSTIVEAAELLRAAGTERSLVAHLFDSHGGPAALLRRNAKHLNLFVTLVSPAGTELGYELSLLATNGTLSIEHELASMGEPGQPPEVLLLRVPRSYSLASSTEVPVARDELALNTAALLVPELRALQSALESIEIHTAVEARPQWASGDPGARGANILRPVARVEPGGRNLPNVYYALKEQPDWPQTLELVQLALGDHVEAVSTPADPSGGRIGLALRIRGLGDIPAFALSDGQLAYLAHLGVLRLARPEPPALVVFDEPDLHLHPSLARRVMADLETFARKTSVLVATQSDAMLDALSDPARSTVLCELDEHHATQLLRPDATSLAKWLDDYRGVGELRAAGYERSVFPALVNP